MFRKKILILLMVILFLLSAVNISFGQEQKTTIFKLGHVVQVGHSWDVTVREFARLIKERTDGRISIEIFPARQLGGDRDMFESIQVGSLDMGVISSSPIENFTPVFTGLQLPWLFKNLEIEKKALKSDVAKEMLKELSNIGVKGLAIYDCGFRHFLNNKRPINVPEDMKGLKFRAVESPLVINMFKFLGANPTPMPYGEIYTAVQTNVVDGLDIGFRAGYDEKFFEVAKYYSISSHFTFPTVLVMNQKLFDELSPGDQKIFQDTAFELVDYNFEVFQKQDKEVEPKIREMGVKINYIKDLSPFRKLMQPIYDDYKTKHPLVKKFVNYVEEISQ